MVGRASGMAMFDMAIGTVYVSLLSNYIANSGHIYHDLRRIFGIIFRTPSEEKASESFATPSWRQFSINEMLTNPLFYINWFQFFTLACVSLMLTGHLAQIVSFQSAGTLQCSYLMVVLLVIFNSFG